MKRIPSGVIGFDELIQGGFPQGASILVSGGAGSGKSIFCMTYIYEGARKYGDPGLYVTVEDNLKNIVWNMENFGWDIKTLEQRNLMRIYRIHIDPRQPNVEEQVDKELEIIGAMVKDLGATRLVIDSTTAFGAWFSDPGKLRNLLFRFSDYLKDLNCTTLMTCETSGKAEDFSAFGVEEFVVDGVVALYFTPPHRSVFVRKLRGTKHSETVHPIAIKTDGINVNPKDEILWSVVKQY
ncbi:MAG TPA: ATPase domain-containing protein [archaeon]|nr:ATPase domain-containing protein [archaeon]HPC10010.1 ATPase domain-containing protein [archaeon]HRT02837.1 ATPase domain-containing protein [Candidatus Diapherotrites archaeon]